MKIMAVIKYVFPIVGLAMIVSAFLMFTNTQEFLKNAVIADGVVIDFVSSRSSDDSYTYRPIVEFKTKEGLPIKFTSSLGSDTPSYSVGDAVDVLYQPLAPERAKINSFFSLWGAVIILGVFGGVFFIAGFSSIYSRVSTAKKIEFLKTYGISLQTDFQSVEVNTSISVNGRHPYKVHSQWLNPSTSQLHVFSSENIWFDPTNHIGRDKIIVLIERDNPSKYYMDISFLPKLAS